VSDSRRRFLSSSIKLFAGTAALTSTHVFTMTHEHHSHGSEKDGITVPSYVINTCGTCEFWGGMRKVSEDKNTIKAQSMGWCNNPDSPNYQNLTSVDHVMKKSGIWKKWSVLDL
jgi:hypothetical protein